MKNLIYEPFNIDYEISTTENAEGKRLYVTPDGCFPSATTVLDATQDKTFLVEWRNRIGHEKADSIARQMREFGTRLHLFIEKRIQTGQFPTARFDVINAWKELEHEFEKKLGVVHGSEVSMWSKTIGVSGTSDCIGYWGGVPSIIDFKTSRSTKRVEWIEHYFIQSVLYAVMAQERFGFKAKQIVLPIFSLRGESNVFVARISDYYDAARRTLDEYRRVSERVLSQTG